MHTELGVWLQRREEFAYPQLWQAISIHIYLPGSAKENIKSVFVRSHAGETFAASGIHASLFIMSSFLPCVS